MSKTKAFLTLSLLVLLGSMGAIQAQTLARVTLLTDTAKAAREGGKQRGCGGRVPGHRWQSPQSIASYTLTYSVPVAVPGVNLTGYDLPVRATWKKE